MEKCYVTEDGRKTDLDLGHTKRFLDSATSQNNNVTTGKIYQTVIENLRTEVIFRKNCSGYSTYYQ